MYNEIIVAKRRRRYLERIWRRTATYIYNHIMSKAKSDYHILFTSINSENPRQMWKSVNTILHFTHCLNILHWIHCVVLFQITLHIRLLVFDNILSLMVMTMISLNLFLNKYCIVSHLQLLMKFSLLLKNILTNRVILTHFQHIY